MVWGVFWVGTAGMYAWDVHLLGGDGILSWRRECIHGTERKEE